MEAALAMQETQLHTVSRALINFKKIGKVNHTPASIRQRMTALKGTWDRCLQHHAALLQLCPPAQRESVAYFRDDWLDAHECLCQEALDHMADCLEELEPFVSPSVTLNSTLAHPEGSSLSLRHLPPIELPPFSGKPDEWESFRDRFQSLIIDNRELSDFTRMHFLVASLTSQARDVVAGIKVTAENFPLAWRALRSRFENKRRLVELHVATLYGLPAMTRESASELHALRDKAEQSVAALKGLGRSAADIMNDILVYFVSQKLDSATRRAWKLRVGERDEIPTYADLDRFLSSRALALDDLNPHDTKGHRGSRVTSATAAATTDSTCSLCDQRHFLYRCPQFAAKTPGQRREFVKQSKLCFNCLSASHSVHTCRSRFSCQKCQQKHHTMTHVDLAPPSPAAAATIASSPQEEEASGASSVTALSATTMAAVPTPVVLSTARVTVRSPSGRSLVVRALLDGGSELTFLTEKVARVLRLDRMQACTSTSGLGGADTGVSRSAAFIHISPRDSLEPTFSTTAYILRSLTRYAPRGAPSPVDWKHLADLKLADDDPTGSAPIDLIIGSDLYDRVLVNARHGSVGQPSAIQSHFGWVLSGVTSQPPDISLSAHHVVALHCSLEHELCKFWEVEEIPAQPLLSLDEKHCEEHFQTTHSRRPDGAYVVRLPFREGPPIDIGQSRDIAERQLRSLMRRLEARPHLRLEYSAFLSEYEDLGHMKRVPPPNASQSQCVYIPHHPVIRETSSTTRLRVVFNASSPTTNGKSLNTHLHTGRNLQPHLSAVLSRWRRHRYVYTADVTKMYRQISVDPRDRDYQRILWFDKHGNLQDYQLGTVTYGTASAPFQALRVMDQLAKDEGKEFLLAVVVLLEGRYVDDFLFGADEISQLRLIRDQVCGLLARGGFSLRKWASNDSELLSDIQPDNHGLACNKILTDEDRLTVLGIGWNPASDTFQFQVALPPSVPQTKRAILSTIARLFDPLGWVTPVIIAAKIFLQQLWRVQKDWDEVLSDELLKRWKVIFHSLPLLQNLTLARWTGCGPDTAYVEIHGFSDASTVAYAAVVYLRVTSLSGASTLTLLAGKSKVAPIKTLTVPRLELSAALLLSRLIEFLHTSLKLADAACYCWTDSTVTLAWLSKDPSHWKTFVSHRVSKIHTLLPTAQWRYVPTSDNPADCASRGMLSAELASHDLWWGGPSWLQRDSSAWPNGATPPVPESSLEVRPIVSHLSPSPQSSDLASRYSWWPKLVRVTAYLKRFIENCQKGIGSPVENPPCSRSVTADEFRRARIFWIRVVQSELFPVELTLLKQSQPLPSKSPICALTPYLDSDQVLRVGGRLQNSPLPPRSKHPVILASHPIVALIVRYTHVLLLHAGPQLTLTHLRQEFWILRSRSVVKSVIHRCVVCTREKATTSTQLMGQLPSSRVSAPTRAFLHCGVDYAGPVVTRASAGRGITTRKSYIAVFLCLATRAIHLELVCDYSTPAFLNAYTRFCARRGLPAVIYSDNGTTFTGADKELTRAYRGAVRDPDFLSKTASDHVSWKFIPPHAPHFGGLWEAGVKSVKHHLRRVLGSHTLTFEEFTTVLCRIEACLNSRPLAPLTDSLDDYETLTPGHFLIGSALTTSPEPSLLHLNENRLSRWQIIRQVTERFWRIWQTDYVNTLQQRTKWQTRQPSVPVGAIVLIKNPLLPPCKWELGRVVRCHPGSDGLVRVVTVRTAQSEYKRPITQVCLLPIEIESTSPATEPAPE